MNPRQLLMLFLISVEPGIRTVYDMIRFYDRTDFPSNINANLEPMLLDGLIKANKYSKFNHITEYVITEKGQQYLDKYFKEDEIFEYIQTVHNPKLLMDITKAYIDKIK